MKKILILSLWILLVLFSGIPLFAQDNFNKVFKNLIKSAVQNNRNLLVMEEEVNLYKARVSEAKGAFLPTVDLDTRYSRADGGRLIQFDVNDFIPREVISADIPATTIPFLRETEHETRVSITQPIFQSGAIYYNFKSKIQEFHAAEAKLNSYRQNVAFETVKAFISYLQSIELIKIKKEILNLTGESLSTTRSLFEVEKVPLNDVKRAEVAVAAAEQELNGAENRKIIAGNLLNNLLGKNINVPVEWENTIKIQSIYAAIRDINPDSEELYKLSLKNRYEFIQLDHTLKAIEAAGKINRSNYLPKLAFAFDYGFQGEKYKFDEDHDYWMASFVAKWNIFSGFRHDAVKSQINAQVNSLKKTREDLREKVRLEIRSNYLNFRNSLKQLVSASKQEESAKENFRVVKKQYEEGLASLITFIDAQNSLNIAKSNLIITKYSHIINYSMLLKSTGQIYTRF